MESENMVEILEAGKKGMIIYFKNRNTPDMSINAGGREMTLGDLIGELETDTQFGRKCVVELMYWDTNLFVDTMVGLGLGLGERNGKTYSQPIKNSVGESLILASIDNFGYIIFAVLTCLLFNPLWIKISILIALFVYLRKEYKKQRNN